MTASAEKAEKLPGTRPEGTRDEREASTRVQEMFSRIAPRYDFLNHFLSLSLDHVWRRRTAQRFREILARPEARVLDLCCGTGDLALALERGRKRFSSAAARERRAVTGSDFAQPMLDRAKEKAERGHARVEFAAADALRLPFADGQFDLVTAAFGFRNLANYDEGLREFARVLKQGGELGILEFTEPSSGILAGVFRFYFRHVLPRVGGAISGNREAYAYLPASVAKFPSPAGLAELMRGAGFLDVKWVSWNFGSVVLHMAKKS
ncbi:MAG TPA: bifunctional demethylmenaquinone methyltransferase/2-methoxy-6-polyprenyl-1,4-benzoquinol methylase UbiE [Candidatus Acidoferrum sp.]|nr:bifunctional demethylmenaquinone methyltransferase/2-methoxy-6-polyprenyl-1,4-benzoquinol methylase UbiE [Candidatus Acidoferrum sp.]